MARDPYCRNCGYSLKGLTESSKCPECGRPIIEVLERGPAATHGRRYQSKTVVFGLPLVHIALGPYEDEPYGEARGIIAIGDVATGWLAIGGTARGIFAIGGFAFGIVTFGGLSIGLIAAGGGALGGAALGGGAVGLIASGGGAVGIVAQGGGAVGYYAHGGGAWGRHVLCPYRADPEARKFFSRWAGSSPGATVGLFRWVLVVVGWYVVATIGLGAVLAAIVALAYLRQRRPREHEYR
jgi:hypothetical protein